MEEQTKGWVSKFFSTAIISAKICWVSIECWYWKWLKWLKWLSQCFIDNGFRSSVTIGKTFINYNNFFWGVFRVFAIFNVNYLFGEYFELKLNDKQQKSLVQIVQTFIATMRWRLIEHDQSGRHNWIIQSCFVYVMLNRVHTTFHKVFD